MKRVIGGEFFNPGKSSDIDRNLQRIYVTIRPLNREDSVLYFPPEAFGPFRVLHQIGAGTLGPVFRAYEPAGQRRDRLVAVKVFRLDLTPEQSAALLEELDALVSANINHPNIAAPIAAGLEYGAAYLAQEYAVGDSLDVVLREGGPMAMRDVVALVESVASAIDHAADRGVHHGLLHLRDIIIGADTVRISGFGIAAALEKIGAKPPTRPAYALNAQIAAAAMPADVYSLMAIAFEAATGKRLSADTLKDLEAEHGAAVRAAFEMQPQRAGEFAEALARGAGALGAPGASGGAPTRRAPVAPVAPLAPIAPIAPVAPDEDFDLRLDQPADLMGYADEDPADRIAAFP
ncbi:MAG TPA: protein kinase, partial [Burkholderiales bacterium]|nr:protein kinase [Burkholderiales bacterium]